MGESPAPRAISNYFNFDFDPLPEAKKPDF
jgi:hypothetical protein